MVTLNIDNNLCQVREGESILQSALKNHIYIPHLCGHPDLPTGKEIMPDEFIYRGASKLEPLHNTDKFAGCQLCLVEIEGNPEPQRACQTLVRDGQKILTNTPKIQALRRTNLAKILAQHPHACLTCAQHEGCSLTQCSSNVSVQERCCPKFGRCEIQKVSEYIGIKPETPKYTPQNIPVLDQEPLFTRNYNLCIGCTRCVRMCRDVKGVDALGFVYQNSSTVAVGSKGPTLKESGCKFCGACVEVCPTGALIDKGIKNLSDRVGDLVPCKQACPIGLDIPDYIRSIKSNEPAKALEIIKTRTPFPTVLGRVCFHPCEEVCRRKELNEPIAICALKRFASESSSQIPNQQSEISNQKSQRIAVIGAGPTGLTAAYYLTQLGYPVTIFEAQPEIGGMMRYALPEYRLPLNILQQELDQIIKNNRITIKTNQALGRDFTLESLKQNGFQATFIAIGAQAPKKLKLEGADTPGVLWGIDFLKDIRQNKKITVAKNVLVIGGGNVAIDVALSALRLGAQKVKMVCLESEHEMPAHKWEIAQAREEGIIMHPGWGPQKIITANGKVTGMSFVKCTCVFDEQHRFNPAFNTALCNTIQTDMVIMAIGNIPHLENTTLENNPNKTLKVNEETLATNQPGVFAGGEIAHNPGSVVTAIADGRKAASSINKYLGGTGTLNTPALAKPSPYLGQNKDFAQATRIKMPCLNTTARIGNFKETETGYDNTLAQTEAQRCLQCDLRFLISPITLPPDKYRIFNAEAISQVPEREGVFTLLNDKKEIISIKGLMNIRQGLQEQLTSNKEARYFEYEEDKMFTKRETELIQHFLQQYGRLPGGGKDELDDLF